MVEAGAPEEGHHHRKGTRYGGGAPEGTSPIAGRKLETGTKKAKYKPKKSSMFPTVKH